MKKLITFMTAMTLAASNHAAKADQIPAPLLHSLKQLNLSRPPSLVNGTLYVSYNFKKIELLQARSLVDTVCFTYYGDNPPKRSWKAGRIKDITITNDSVTQGFTYEDGDKSCDQMASMNTDEGVAFMNDRLAAATFKATFK